MSEIHTYYPPSLAEQNIRFAQAMFSARRAGLEKFTVGVVTEAATERPRFTPARSLPMSSCSSPAGACADAAVNFEKFIASR